MSVYLSGRVEVIRGDITTLALDAIVNAANESLLGGAGVDGAIHAAAGRELYDECVTLKGCATGDAKITKGYLLPARHVIHTVGPIWFGGHQREEALLASCYRRSLEVLVEHDLMTVAFPCISTGAYRFPFPLAASIAASTIKAFLLREPRIRQVVLCCFAEQDRQLTNQACASLIGP